MDRLSVTSEDGVAVLVVNRPPVNALDLDLLESIVGEVGRLEKDTPRALVVAGVAGCFSAGVDTKAVVSYGPEQQRRMVEGINQMVVGLYGLRCPVVGAVTGHAIGGGLVLSLCTDVRVASRSGRYGLTEVKVGVAYPRAAIGIVRAELIPPAARLLALGGRLVDADECVRLGVFDEIAEEDAVLARAMQLAAEMASYPAETYVRTKHELRSTTIGALVRAATDEPLLRNWVG